MITVPMNIQEWRAPLEWNRKRYGNHERDREQARTIPKVEIAGRNKRGRVSEKGTRFAQLRRAEWDKNTNEVSRRH